MLRKSTKREGSFETREQDEIEQAKARKVCLLKYYTNEILYLSENMRFMCPVRFPLLSTPEVVR